MGGVFAAVGDSRRYALCLLPVLVVGATLATLTGGSWWWAVLLGGIGALIGWLSSMNRAVPIIEVAIVVATADPLSTLQDLVLYAAFVTLGHLFGVLVARLGGAPEYQERSPFTPHHPCPGGARRGDARGGWSGRAAAGSRQAVPAADDLSDPAGFLLIDEDGRPTTSSPGCSARSWAWRCCCHWS